MLQSTWESLLHFVFLWLFRYVNIFLASLRTFGLLGILLLRFLSHGATPYTDIKIRLNSGSTSSLDLTAWLQFLRSFLTTFMKRKQTAQVQYYKDNSRKEMSLETVENSMGSKIFI